MAVAVVSQAQVELTVLVALALVEAVPVVSQAQVELTVLVALALVLVEALTVLLEVSVSDGKCWSAVGGRTPARGGVWLRRLSPSSNGMRMQMQMQMKMQMRMRMRMRMRMQMQMQMPMPMPMQIFWP